MISRRHFLALAGSLLLSPVPAAWASAWSGTGTQDLPPAADVGGGLSAGAPLPREQATLVQRSLALTREIGGRQARADICYWDSQIGYRLDGYASACDFLRDIHADRVYPMDPRLLDVLHRMQDWLAARGYFVPIEILSGFRTRLTNDALENAAKNSRHLTGQAVDIRIPGLPTALLGRLALAFSTGGVGIYLNRGFIHIDTGPHRAWLDERTGRLQRRKPRAG